MSEDKVKLEDLQEPEVDFQGKTNDELLEVRDTLVQQLQQYQTMAVKASGALEVLNQLVEEKEDSES